MLALKVAIILIEEEVRRVVFNIEMSKVAIILKSSIKCWWQFAKAIKT